MYVSSNCGKNFFLGFLDVHSSCVVVGTGLIACWVVAPFSLLNSWRTLSRNNTTKICVWSILKCCWWSPSFVLCVMYLAIFYQYAQSTIKQAQFELQAWFEQPKAESFWFVSRNKKYGNFLAFQRQRRDTRRRGITRRWTNPKWTGDIRVLNCLPIEKFRG